MTAATYDVTGIGNAIVDIMAEVDEATLTRLDVVKGGMTLVDDARAQALYAAMPPAIETSGGSAANTIAGLARLGAHCGYIGRVKRDQLGGVFSHDIKSLGVNFPTTQAVEGSPTATCMILVTPDAQRSMSTHLGACVELGPEDVDEDLVAKSRVTYLEGYLWDPPRAKDALRRAIKIAKGAGRQVALSLSDAFCVDRWRAEFLALVENEVDILFANESEILSLYQTQDFAAAAAHLRDLGRIAALTRSEKGAVILGPQGQSFDIKAAPVLALVDSTGAGDQFAAGFLFGHCRGLGLSICGRMGAVAAAEVLDHVGPRPKRSVLELFHQAALS